MTCHTFLVRTVVITIIVYFVNKLTRMHHITIKLSILKMKTSLYHLRTDFKKKKNLTGETRGKFRFV